MHAMHAMHATKGATMPVNDLSDVAGLDEKQRAVLSQKLDITICYELIMGDRQRIVDAFGRRTIRPTLEDVAVWQDEARRIYASSIDASVSTITSPGWEQAAAFVVAFEERRRGDATQRRIVAEQAEIEPEASSQQRSEWEGWECADACRWMRERVGGPALPSPPQLIAALPSAGEPRTAGTADKAGPASPPATGTRSKLAIERVSLADSGDVIELIAGSRPLPQSRLVWTGQARLHVTLGGAPAGPRTSVVLQLVRLGGGKHNIAGRLDDLGRAAEFELSGLADGAYEPTFVASTPDGSALPCVVRLPAIEVAGGRLADSVA